MGVAPVGFGEANTQGRVTIEAAGRTAFPRPRLSFQRTDARMCDNLIDAATVRKFLTLLHERAAAALRPPAEVTADNYDQFIHPDNSAASVARYGRRPPMAKQAAVLGVLQLCCMRPDDKTMRRSCFRISNIEGMADAAVTAASAGFNVYTELRTVYPGTSGRGDITQTHGVFAFGIDRDADTNKAGRALNGDASVVTETSPGNTQEILFLDCALTPEEAAPIGEAIRKATGADGCTGNVVQPFRVPGTINYPSAKKLARGRVTAPARIVSIKDRVWTKDELLAAFPPPPSPQPRAARPTRRKPKSCMRVAAKVKRKATARMDRSAEFQSAVAAAVRGGMTPDELEETMRANPQGCAGKYLEGTDRLRAEIERSWAKAEQSIEDEPVIKPDPHADGAVLLDDVRAFLGRFVVYPSEHAHVAHTLWVAHTHRMDVWESTPRIAFLSPEPETGKTRALEVSELLVPRPVMAMNVSSAYLFRKVGADDGLPTILFDEADTVFGPKAKEHEDVRGMLNAGHRKGAVAGRCIVRGQTVETEELPAYCAVALAGIGDLPDTILSRSVIVRMRRRAPHETVEPFRPRVVRDAGRALRDRLAAWAAGAIPRIAGVWPEMPNGVQDRAADVWEALLAVADAAGGHWPSTARVTSVTLVTLLQGERGETSLGLRLLADMRAVFGDSPTLATAVILTKLVDLPESLWADVRGKPLNDRGLAVRLRWYEIKPKVVRVGSCTHRGYARDDFLDAWPPSPGESVTSVTSETSTARTRGVELS